jgi:hypothetical protein
MLIEEIASALVVSRQKQLGIPILVNIWPKLPKEIKVNALKDALEVLSLVKRLCEDDVENGVDTLLHLKDEIADGEQYLKELE